LVYCKEPEFMLCQLRERLIKLRNSHYFAIDITFFLLTPILALLIRLDGDVDFAEYFPGLVWAVLLFLIIKLTVLRMFDGYKRCWQYASIDELQQIAIAGLTSIVVQTVCFTLFYFLPEAHFNLLPRSLPLLDGILSFLLVGVARFSTRLVDRLTHRHRHFHRRDRVLIVGAGSAGIALVQEMQRNPSLGLRPVGFVDDNPAKHNLRIRRLPVFGDRHKIPELVHLLRLRRVIIAMPTAPGYVIREVLDICQQAGIPTSTLPGIDEILNGRVTVDKIREVEIKDLLRRAPIQIDTQQVSSFIAGKRVLITGAGGSIGSELCRQILKCAPAAMVLVGHGENSIFNIQQELENILRMVREEDDSSEPLTQIFACIADIRTISRLEFIFSQFKPEVIFHAAAHKHVPMMELNAPEAITNNVLGTKNLVDLALNYGVENFVMVSTDKAVNPTNIMGASKRVAEMVVLQAAQRSGKRYVVVRFGNVLGSRGSVIPTFKRQIAEGGPITVTHPDICRYFMTIPEAVQLVLQAAVVSKGGEVLMLDMGQPVKIVDLAEELIRLSGYEVGKQIDIVFTGLRPGEKLYEELFVPGEHYEPTKHKKLFMVVNASRIIPKHLDRIINLLCQAAWQNDASLIAFLLEQLVSGYKPHYLVAAQSSAIRESGAIVNNNPTVVPQENSLKTEPAYGTPLKMRSR
jgi:FlaA1/EpsC-like NDP-sugar epimerase